jgi:6-phospho-beta-glucosidase
MASIKLAYLGGGSSRAPGTMAAFLHNHGANFQGSEVVLIDLVPERLAIVERLARRMAEVRGLDIRITATTDRRAGLRDVDAVLSSYRPGGFEARARRAHPHGARRDRPGRRRGRAAFFMALRSIAVLQAAIADLEAVAPRARIFNYTNPVNIVAQAATMHTDIPFTSFCEGTYDFPRELADAAGLDRSQISARMIGLNHTTWSVDSRYGDAPDAMPAIRQAWAGMKDEADVHPHDRRFVELAVAMDAIPSQYLRYFYFHDEILTELRAKATTRSEDILASIPDHWAHLPSSRWADPVLDPARSRGGIFELELALDAMDSHYHDLGRVLPCNIPNAGTPLQGFAEDLVVEVFARVDCSGFHAEPHPALPRHVRGLIEILAEYQVLTAEAACRGRAATPSGRWRAIRGCCRCTRRRRLHDEMAAAHRAHLPERSRLTCSSGVDGGATKTVALIADADVGDGRRPQRPSDITPRRPAEAVQRVAKRSGGAEAPVATSALGPCVRCAARTGRRTR